MTMAFDAAASSTSDSLIAPTPLWMMRIFTLLVAQLRERVGEHFRRTLHVGLDDDRQLLHAAFGNLLLQRLEREAAALGAERARPSPASCRNIAIWRALAASASAWNASPGCGRPPRPSTSTGVDGPAVLICRPRSSISARTLPTIGAGDERVADVERAVLHEDRRDRPASLIELRFEHRARGVALGIGLQLADVGDEQHHLEQQRRGSRASWPTPSTMTV